MSTIRACIFDLDGVLVDTAKYHFLAWKRLADMLGIDFTLEDNERLKGVSRMASLDIILSLGKRELPAGEKLRLAELKNGWYRDYLAELDESALLPGVRDFLLGCKALGLSIAVGSASKSAREVLESTGILGLFEAVVDGNAPVPPKPAPDIFLVAGERLGVRPLETIVFEDAEAGIEAAIAAGMRTIGTGEAGSLPRAELVIPGFAGLEPRVLLGRLG
ncbi:MAG TPA: beta-phosphoglucomutase [Rectinemataceae bacterium]|nr:beta-phosphoglucomutase [Rectinemataceae bacterium]